MKYCLPHRGIWRTFTDEELQEHIESGHPETAKAKRELWEEFEKNRLAFFLGHGGQVPFINDRDHDLVILDAGNQWGKTVALIVWLLTRAIPCKKETWPCFTPEHGLDWHEWDGPKKCAIASYEMSVHCRRNLWPKLRDMIPAAQFKHRNKDGTPKAPNWQAAPCVDLMCGTTIDFFAYRQPAEAFESMSYDLWAFDEQVPEDIFDAAYARGTTSENFQAAIAMTPHIVPGRPNTGAGGWVVRMRNGLLSKGINWSEHHISAKDVPPEIVSEKKKKQLYKKYITEPQASGNQRKIREGRSRWEGLPESSEGLVYDNWDTNVHWIDPVPINPDWTLQRTVDHGQHDPCATLWSAYTQWGDLILFREYYENEPSIARNVHAIIEMSGNRREKVSEIRDEYEGSVRAIFTEVEMTEHYQFTVMDPRSFSSPADSGDSLGMKYNELGLPAVKIDGTGIRDIYALPQVHDWFEMDPERTHLLYRLGVRDPKTSPILGADGKPIVGAPKLYVFNTLSHFRAEIEGYIYKLDSEKPVDKHDHSLTALKYLILARPRYDGALTIQEAYPEAYGQDEANARTGYAGANARYF